MPHYVGYDAYRRHWLFRAIRRFVIAERANGMCEVCEASPATEVHHEKYPAWGAFDSPGNMKAICHECHSEKHGKLV